MRTMRLHLEDRLNIEIHANHPLLSWLAIWACEAADKYKVRGGRSAYELVTGHKVQHAVYSFGRQVWGLWSADKNIKSIKNDHDSTWSEAYVVGMSMSCGGYLLTTRDQIYKVSTVKAKTENESFSAQMIEEVAI